MKKFKLSTQLLILFSTVTFLSSLIFGYISYRNYQSVYLGLARNEVNNFVEATISAPRETEDYLGYIQITVRQVSTFEATVTSRYLSPNSILMIGEDTTRTNKLVEAAYLGNSVYRDSKGILYLSIKVKNIIDDDTKEYYIGVMDNTYIDSVKAVNAKEEVLMTFVGTFLAFAIIVLLGNAVVAIWSRNTTSRIKDIQKGVSQFNSTGYENKIVVEGDDEISELGRAIETLRIEIKENEKTKQEMFQNVSHDLKTPISVIQSYAEAILDGTTEVEDAKVIIKQSEKLQAKVRMLLELSKIATLEVKEKLEYIKLKDIINQVLFNNKHRLNHIDIKTDLDDSKFYGVREYLYTSIENMVDNATRYAKSCIVVTLKNEVLTFYNDGPSIEEKYIKEGFKPYEKGSRGQFGIGMSIVQKTFNKFGYALTVENIDQGVKFTIKPLL